MKGWGNAKTRMSELRTDDRRALAFALAQDTVRTVCATPDVELCVVVGPGEVLRDLRRCAGLEAVRGVEERREASADSLNMALLRGRDVALSAGYRQLAMIVADLPALSVTALRGFLRTVPAASVAIVCDRSGSGTTIVAGRRGERVLPAFGPNSAARHIANGAVDVTSRCDPWLRADVDTVADLATARGAAVGPALRRWFDGGEMRSENRQTGVVQHGGRISEQLGALLAIDDPVIERQ
ncbi:2-phospho-L-lactate guanylyltransferase [Haloechinothrix salitolerans]|uniref:2-phospho-L-lactate guanylyltransferase n=1 Tax=Haloechinothrix salitolerans TaxID=926830 RepID=A0ABW2BX16_9PSEU